MKVTSGNLLAARCVEINRMTAHVQVVPKPTNSLFELTLLHCIYERVSNDIQQV